LTRFFDVEWFCFGKTFQAHEHHTQFVAFCKGIDSVFGCFVDEVCSVIKIRLTNSNIVFGCFFAFCLDFPLYYKYAGFWGTNSKGKLEKHTVSLTFDSNTGQLENVLDEVVW